MNRPPDMRQLMKQAQQMQEQLANNGASMNNQNEFDGALGGDNGFGGDGGAFGGSGGNNNNNPGVVIGGGQHHQVPHPQQPPRKMNDQMLNEQGFDF